MAPITGPIQSPVSAADTPTPYRLSTEAVRTWQPRPATTEEIHAIRISISPNRGWWQNIRPGHIVTYVISYTVIVGGLFAFAASHGVIR